MKKILIAIPCMDQVPAPFAQSLAMIRKGENHCAVAFQMGSLIYTSRNNLAKKAIEDDYDFVFWLDSDMVFQQDTLLRMLDVLEKNNLDFLTGLYFRRVAPFSPVLFSKLEIFDNGNGCDWEEPEEVPAELTEVAGCGFGCVLMKTDVIFDVATRYGANMFNPFSGLGEDLAFCWRARDCGYKIYCDPSIACGHVGYSVVTHNFYVSYRDAHQKEELEDVQSN